MVISQPFRVNPPFPDLHLLQLLQPPITIPLDKQLHPVLAEPPQLPQIHPHQKPEHRALTPQLKIILKMKQLVLQITVNQKFPFDLNWNLFLAIIVAGQVGYLQTNLVEEKHRFAENVVYKVRKLHSAVPRLRLYLLVQTAVKQYVEWDLVDKIPNANTLIHKRTS